MVPARGHSAFCTIKIWSVHEMGLDGTRGQGSGPGWCWCWWPPLPIITICIKLGRLAAAAAGRSAGHHFLGIPVTTPHSNLCSDTATTQAVASLELETMAIRRFAKISQLRRRPRTCLLQSPSPATARTTGGHWASSFHPSKTCFHHFRCATSAETYHFWHFHS